MGKIKSKSYTLYSENGGWLGQVVITSDGMFASVTDWGNLSYSWRSFNGDFRSFLCDLNIPYFGSKLAGGLAYIIHNRTVDKACDRFAEKILPALQKALKEDINNNVEW